MNALRKWAAAQGIVTNQLDLQTTTTRTSNDPNSSSNNSNDNDGCFGVTALSDLTPGACVLTVPSRLIFSSQKIQQDLTQTFGNSLDPALDHIRASVYRSQLSHFILLLKLLMEYEKQDDSLWYPWVQSLPRTFDTAIAMTDLEMDCLPPFAWALANVERKHLVVFQQALEMLPDHVLPTSVTTNKHLTEWAFQVVFTRAWRYPKSRSPKDKKDESGNEDEEEQEEERCDIVPFGDMFNHNAHKNLNLDYDDEDDLHAYVVGQRNVTAGTPLEISYGRPTNPYRFLTIFGFCDTQMPEIFSQITLENPTKRHQDLGYDLDGMVFRTLDGAISKPVWDVLLYSILEQKPDMQERFYQAHVQGDAETTAQIHERYLLETCLTLKKHVDRTLYEMDALLFKMDEIVADTDAANGKSSKVDASKGKHSRLGLIRQNNEFVRSVFAKVKQRVDGMIQAQVLERRESVASSSSSSS